MLLQRIREGVRAGLIAAAATAGVLIGLGSAHHAAMRPLNSVAHILIGSRAYYMEGVDPIVTPLGVVAHVLSIVIWGILLATVTRTLGGVRLYGAALAFAGFTWLLDLRLLPERLRPGFESGLSGAEIATVYLVLALSLAWGLDRERRLA